MKVTMVLVESIALAVWSVVGILPVLAEPISNTPVGLQAGDHARWMGISTVVGAEWIPNGTTLETILDPSPRSLKTGTLLDLLDHSCGGAATAFDAMWTGSATKGGAVDLGRIGGVGAAVLGRNSSVNALWTPAEGAEASVSKR